MPAAINGMKECSKCHEVKAVGEFYKNTKSRDGLYSSCKECHNKATRKIYHEQNGIERSRKKNSSKEGKEYKKNHYVKNKKKYKERAKKWYSENRERYNELARIRRSENRERYNEYHREYYIKNYEYNKKKHSEYMVEYRKNNPEKWMESQKKYRENNPEKVKEWGINHRRNQSKNLTDPYLYKRIQSAFYKKNIKVKKEDIPYEYLDVYRVIIKIHRYLKEEKQNERTISTGA